MGLNLLGSMMKIIIPQVQMTIFNTLGYIAQYLNVVQLEVPKPKLIHHPVLMDCDCKFWGLSLRI